MKTMTPDHSRPILSLLLLLTCASLTCAQSNNESPPPVSPYKFNSSMLIIIFVLISAFFFMGFFSIYIRQCAGESATVFGSRHNGVTGRSRRAMRGLDPSVIDTFPILEYSVVKGLKIGRATLECAVCLSEFEDEETLRLLPKCNHVFHPDCIDAWLKSHTTCPVCRANLVPGSDADAAASGAPDPVPAAGEESESESESPPDHVAIAIDPAPSGGLSQPDVIKPSQMPFQIQNRPIRSKSSRIPARFPRSHSTGHSLVQPGENVDRYTLRLPENVRKEIMSGHLKRTTSLVAFPREGGSVSGGSSHRGRGYRGGGGGGEGSSRGRSGFQFGRFDRASRSDRWVFSMTPPFVSRTGSLKSQKRLDAEMSGSSKGVFNSVKTPFDCLGAKSGEASEPGAARGSTPVFTISSPQQEKGTGRDSKPSV